MSTTDWYRDELRKVQFKNGRTLADAVDWEVIRAVERGEADWYWSKVVAENDDYLIELTVMGDAMKLGGVRFNVNALEQQMICDMVEAIMPTALISDLAWTQADITFKPVTSINGRIVALVTAQQHSEAVDKLIAGQRQVFGIPNLIRPVGKIWIVASGLEPRLLRTGHKYKEAGAFNHGWHTVGRTSKNGPYHSRSTRGQVIWQNTGGAHNDIHKDGSQVQDGVGLAALITDKQSGLQRGENIVNLLKDENTASMLSHEGPLKVFRMFRMPKPPSSTIVLPPTTIVGQGTPAV